MFLVPFAAQFWTSNIQIAVHIAMSALGPGRSKSAPAEKLTGLSAAGPGASSTITSIGYDDIGFVGQLLYNRSVPSAVFMQMYSVGLLVFSGASASNSSDRCCVPSCFVPPLSGPSTEWWEKFHCAVRQTAATLFSGRAVVICPRCSETVWDTLPSQLLFAALVKKLSGLAVQDTLRTIGAWKGYLDPDELKVH